MSAGSITDYWRRRYSDVGSPLRAGIVFSDM